MKILSWLAVLALVLVTGCSAVESVFPPAEDGRQGDLLYQDDFSDPRSGWDTWDKDESAINYQDGGLRMLVKVANRDVWSRPQGRYDNVRVAVTVKRLSGPKDNDFGIICRYQDPQNFYAFLASSDGYVSIVKVLEGEYTLLGSKTMEFRQAIRTDDSVNHIGAECSGSRLVLYANGELLLSAKDDEFSEGGVGLIAGAMDKPNVELLFDNFIVTRY